MRYLKLYIIVILLLSCTSKETDQFVSFDMDRVEVILISDNSLELRLPFTIKDGYHIQLPNPSNPQFIPTELTINRSKAFSITDTNFEFDEKSIAHNGFEGIYDAFNVIINLNLMDEESTNVIGGSLNYQTCDKAKCFFPRTLYFKLDLKHIKQKASGLNQL